MPVLDYCGFLHNGVIDGQHRRLQLIQNRGLRICLNVKIKYPVINLHTDANLDFLGVRYDMQLLLLLHKYLYSGKHDPALLGLCFQIANPAACRTRSVDTGLLAYPRSIKTCLRKSPIYRGIDLWNQLNSSCRLSAKKDTFKAKALPKVRALFLAKNARYNK